MGCHDRELSILFTDDEGIARLNAQYLGREGATNVLAFSMLEGSTPTDVGPMLGDVVVSVERALAEADEAGVSPEWAIDRLLIHGLLHLLGYDHESSAAEAERMECEERRLLAMIHKG